MCFVTSQACVIWPSLEGIGISFVLILMPMALPRNTIDGGAIS